MSNQPHAVSMTWRYYVTLFVTAVGASFQFYSYGVLNPPQALVEKWVNVTYADRFGSSGLTEHGLTVFWSFTASSISIGAVIGALVTRPLCEHVGRRSGLVYNGIVNVLAGCLSILAKPLKSPELLISGRLLYGMCMGVSSGLCPMYLMEITPVQRRGAAGTVHQILVAFSDWFSLFATLPIFLGNESLWPYAVALPAVPAAVLVLVLPWMPESPRFLLITRRKRAAAKRAIERLVKGRKCQKQIYDELAKEAFATLATLTGGRPLPHVSDLWRRRSLRRALFIALTVMVAQQFTGVGAVFTYSTSIFETAGLDLSAAQYATVGTGLAYMLSTIPSPYLIERVGRRGLSLFQLAGVLAALIAFVASMFAQERGAGASASYSCVASMTLYMVVYGVGSPVAWLIASELFSMQYRGHAVTMSTFLAWTGSFVITLAYPPFKTAVGSVLSFLPFIVVVAIALVILACLLPETKNRPVEDIVREFRQRSRSFSRTFTNLKLGGLPPDTYMDHLLEGDSEEPVSSEEDSDAQMSDLVDTMSTSAETHHSSGGDTGYHTALVPAGTGAKRSGASEKDAVQPRAKNSCVLTDYGSIQKVTFE